MKFIRTCHCFRCSEDGGTASPCLPEYVQLAGYSDRDALTGLLNRKSLDDAFYSAVLEELDGVVGGLENGVALSGSDTERRHRVPANYWLGTVRIDNFSAINDKFGHTMGEEVILLVAQILNNTFRTYDYLYRFWR